MNYCHKTHKPETSRQLLEMAQEDQSETSQQTAASDEEKGMMKQASPPVIEIHDSTTECVEETRPNLVQMEEKAFVSSLHSFMKDKGSPIERIPHLGFKQINLWRIYKAVEKRGGYDLVTAQRLWKKVYDELGGSPGSTSAATCTRRHYERLVLPFERHMKGEEDKPLPPSKPRKPYKRNLEGKVNKAEVKRKRTQSDREMDSEILTQRSPEAACQSEAVMHPHSALWAATTDRHHPDCSQPNRAPADLCTPVYAHLLPVPTSSPWTAHIPSAAGEVISPLEKKKRMAQASLNLPPSPQSEDKERPSVIRCSQSPARASSSQNCNSSDGSPLPLSSSSSRSPSPYSVSSEDGPAGNEDKPRSSAELRKNCSGSVKNALNCSEDDKSASCTQISKELAGLNKDLSHVSSQSLIADSIKSQIKDSAWKPIHKGSGKHFTHPFHSTSTSSFTKVIPKSVQLLRPAPIRPSYKIHQNRLMHQDDPLTCAKKLNNVAPWLYQTEKREKSRTMLQKVPPAQQSLSHSTGTLPVSCVLSSYDKLGRDSRHQPPLHPVFLPNRMRLPQSQLMYRHIPVGPAHSALIGSACYTYPYSFPLLNPQTGYTLPAMNPIYPHKL
ncbi:AT-rich interactive domain-containing protein 5A [Xiphias gladius]|uniref:AT-rich interactive domain-containing protein 5A n=1 Tax=Xiphias gladius TaxID=8245 RepID=UPI001A99FD64|nr:AT-rich interactive domain-containing protein 5A [Xiphias gladius]